jgi:hypothetical protein
MIEDKVEAVYRRGDLFKRQVVMMAAWDKFCTKTNNTAKGTPIRRKRV